MTVPNYPSNPTLGQLFVVGNVTFQWDGEKWKALSSADGSLRAQLAATDSAVLVGGVEAGKIAKRVALATLATGIYPVGAQLKINERDGAVFDIVSGGTANGFDILDAGSGKTAVLRIKNRICNIVHFGAVALVAANFAANESDESKTSFTTGITASSTQTQAAATLLSARVNEVSTVATAGDAVKLPLLAVVQFGGRVSVLNSGANSCRLYPNTSNDLGAGSNNFINLAVGEVAEFMKVTATRWARTA